MPERRGDCHYHGTDPICLYGAAEAPNGIIQTVQRKSRGFRTVEYFVAMIYLVASKLEFDLPDPIPSAHTDSH